MKKAKEALRRDTYVVLFPELVLPVSKVTFPTDMAVLRLLIVLAELRLIEIVKHRDLDIHLLSGNWRDPWTIGACGLELRRLSRNLGRYHKSRRLDNEGWLWLAIDGALVHALMVDWRSCDQRGSKGGESVNGWPAEG